MHLNELISLINWFNKNIQNAGVIQAYNKLHKLLNQNAQPNQQKVSFEEQRKDLDNILRSIPLVDLSLNQINFLCDSGVLDSLGIEAANKVNNILIDNTHDITTAAQKIAELRDPINKIISNFQKIQEGLSEIYSIPTEEYEEALINVHFSGKASINNIVEFKKWALLWHEIGRGISMSIGENPEDFRIVGASQGSIILYLATTYGIAKIISDILLIAITVRERVVKLEIEKEKLRSLKLSNDTAEKALQKEIDDEIKSSESKVFEHLKEQLSIDGEKENALEKSVKASFKFISYGGVIDVHIHEEVIDDEKEENNENKHINREKLITITKQIREIEERIKQIEYKNNSDID